MKKFYTVAAAAVMALSLAACSSKTAETTAAEETAAETEAAAEAESTEEAEEAVAVETVNPGKLTVATSPDFAPYEFYAIDENGDPQLAGFDMSLVQYIADYMGLELEIIPMDFDGTIMELHHLRSVSQLWTSQTFISATDSHSSASRIMLINSRHLMTQTMQTLLSVHRQALSR